MRGVLLASSALSLSLFACAEPCKTQGDCGFGAYCLFDFQSETIIPRGECVRDCWENADCAGLELASGSTAFCSNEGRCELDVPHDILRVHSPEPDAVFASDTRVLRVSGEVVTAAKTIRVQVGLLNQENGCGGWVAGRVAEIHNPNPGMITAVPFVIDDVAIDPGSALVDVRAHTDHPIEPAQFSVDVPCASCPKVQLISFTQTAPYEIAQLEGRVDPPVDFGIWRVFSDRGDVLDAAFTITSGAFLLERLPIFPGQNRVEILAADSLGRTPWGRCSTFASSLSAELGVRSILQWDGDDVDLDLYLVPPSSVFEDQQTEPGVALNPSRSGLVPEVATIAVPEDGEYGVIVKSKRDGGAGGGDAQLRVLFDGRPLQRGPIGPAHVSHRAGEMWIAGTIVVRAKSATWRDIDRIVSASTAPTTNPASW